MINIYYKSVKQKELSKLDKFKNGSLVVAIDPNEEEIKEISSKCKFEKDLIIDATDPFEVPRVESQDNSSYVFTRYPKENLEEEPTVPILIAINKNFVLIVSKEKPPFLDKFLNNRQIIRNTTQKVKLFLQIFSEITHSYNKLLINIRKRVRRVRIRLKKIRIDDVIRFVDFERILNDFLSALIPTYTILQNLLKRKHLKLYKYDEELVEELLLSVRELIESSQATLKNTVNLRSAYSNLMSQELNRTMKILTSLTIILMVPTLITSFYGMNVQLPFSKSPIAFLLILLLNLFLTFLLYIVFIRKRLS